MGQSNGVLLKEMSFYRGLTVCVYSRTSIWNNHSFKARVHQSQLLSLNGNKYAELHIVSGCSEPFIISILYLK
jgi:hypothetical protein